MNPARRLGTSSEGRNLWVWHSEALAERWGWSWLLGLGASMV